MSSYHGLSSQSPRSSSGRADSADGTPDTSLTAFSPEEVRTSRASITSSIGGVSLSTCQHDPFITTAHQSARPLSATASTFHPVFRSDQLSSHIPAVSGAIAAKPGNSSDTALTRLSMTNSGSKGNSTQEGSFSTDTGATRCFKVSAIYDVDVRPLADATLQNIIKGGFKFTGSKIILSIGNIVYFRFSNLEEAALVYTTIKTEHPKLATEYMGIDALGQILSPKAAKKSAHEGQIVLTASYPINVSAALDKKAFEDAMRNMLQVEGKLCAWQKISATEAGTFRLIAEFEDVDVAQRAVKRCKGIADKTISKDGVGLHVQLHEPDLAAPRAVPPQSTPTRRSAENTGLGDAMSSMTLGSSHGAYANTDSGAFKSPVLASEGLPFMHAGSPYALPHTSSLAMNGMGAFYPPNHSGLFQQGFFPGLAPQLQHVPRSAPSAIHRLPHSYEERSLGRASFAQAHNDNEAAYYDGRGVTQISLKYDQDNPNRRQNAVKLPNHNRGRTNTAAAHHNHVEVSRIQQGIDVRTTVMLRNIPNKLDQAQLKSILDESSFGKYDFMYLRIDFSNNCNVGYAFINFNDPLDIVDFVRARSGEKWFKSDKVAEVSYATIQGKDCLVQKFRNSSVMLEPPHYRPKLYRTFTDPFGRVGEEEHFPESDNASKLKRSCENAEHVGLFAPSAGQHMRDEQRRRRSQYDRGTSLAEREEYVYDGYEAIQEEYPATSPYGYQPY